MFSKGSIGQVFTWDEVTEVHRAQHGIYQRDGRLVSLLTDFGRINPCYPDVLGDTQEVIHYTGSGRRGDQKFDLRNRSLLAAVDDGHLVPLFNKLGVNRWQYLGVWKVTEPRYIFDEDHDRMVWRFTLIRAAG